MIGSYDDSYRGIWERRREHRDDRTEAERSGERGRERDWSLVVFGPFLVLIKVISARVCASRS